MFLLPVFHLFVFPMSIVKILFSFCRVQLPVKILNLFARVSLFFRKKNRLPLPRYGIQERYPL